MPLCFKSSITFTLILCSALLCCMRREELRGERREPDPSTFNSTNYNREWRRRPRAIRNLLVDISGRPTVTAGFSLIFLLHKPQAVLIIDIRICYIYTGCSPATHSLTQHLCSLSITSQQTITHSDLSCSVSTTTIRYRLTHTPILLPLLVRHNGR